MKKIARILKRLLLTAKIYLPIKKHKKIAENVIVSLTSYPARLNKIHLVIRSLLHQKIRAETIILYLGTDSKESDLPNKLLKLKKYGFVIKMGYPDIKPHKKYFFAMQEYSKKTVITVDDDLIYDDNLIKDLTECQKKYPGCVCARRVNLITKNSMNQVNKYKDWKWEYTKITEPSYSLLATGCGGILYPAGILPSETFDIENIKKYCLNTDDIWLKFMELEKGIKVVFSNSKTVHPLTIRHSQESSLMQSNTKNESINDVNIRLMEDFTELKLSDYV